MLAIDDDPESTWCSAGRADGTPPDLLIIDMIETKTVSKILGTGHYLDHLQFFVTDALPFEGYESYSVDWLVGDESRVTSYDDWVNSMTALIPDDLPQGSWGEGEEIAALTDEEDTDLLPSTFPRDEDTLLITPLTGRYLIILFRDSAYYVWHPWDQHYVAISNLEVYD
jgi:hypothetical protein